MTLTLYINNSDTNEVNKNIIEIKTLNGDLRNVTNLKNPVFEIEASYDIVNEFDYVVDEDNDDLIDADGDDIGYLFSGNIFKINYIYCQEFQRYYYVDDITILNNNLFAFNCSEDVLMSFKDDFLQLDAIISRNEYNYNNMIEDEKSTYLFNKEILIDDLQQAEITFNPLQNKNDVTYAITYLQKNASSEDYNYITSPTDALPNVNSIGTGSGCFSKTRFAKRDSISIIRDYIIEHESDASFIISVVAYPFKIPFDTSLEPLVIGSHNYGTIVFYDNDEGSTDVSGYYQIAQLNGNALFENATYRDFEPYTIYEIYLAYYGYVEIKSSDIVDSIIKIYYSFNWADGTAKINIVNETKDYVIKSVTANIGVVLSVNRTNQQQLNDERTQLAIKSTIGALTGALSIGVGVGTSNPFLIRGGVTTLGSTAVDIGEKLALQHERASTSNNSGIDGCYGTQTCFMKRTKYVVNAITDYNKYYGKPTNATYNLSQLSGYTEIKDIHLDNINATKEEIDELYTLLLRGIRL